MRRKNPWLRTWHDAWSPGIEASSVIALRTLKFAAGGVASEVEAARRTPAHYRRKVRANIRRLAKP